jgi:hypothetical protein
LCLGDPGEGERDEERKRERKGWKGRGGEGVVRVKV